MIRTPLRSVSRKQQARNRALAETKIRLFEDRGPQCEGRKLFDAYLLTVKAPYDDAVLAKVLLARDNCHGIAVDMHHIARRGFKGCDEDSNLLLACRRCHQLATDSDPIAYLVGLARRHNVMQVAS